MPESIWITLVDPDEYEGIESAIIGLDGVSSVRDQRQIVGPVLQGLEVMRIGALGIAAFLVVAALLLVANTIRLAAFARRREIGIMRLVGASTLYIALPFLMEALVTAAIAVAVAIGALGAFMWFGVHKQLEDLVGFIPWIGVDEFTVRRDRGRDPRPGAHPASDTRVDAQIPQSLSPRVTVVAFTSPNTKATRCVTSPVPHASALRQPLRPARSRSARWLSLSRAPTPRT